ncbi:MAG TPA: tetratricopeptide repeat protein [candidate division Zixibacteria bacterium]|nr:tetratricopeptide repeat protein [candidate division Zixibacteria bacterium]
MYFDNLSDPSDSNRMGEMCSDLLITGLSDNPDIHILSSQRIYDILKKLGKEGQRQVDLETANTIAKEAHARWMLVGKIIQTNPLLVTTQILDTYTGDLRAAQRSAAESGENIFEQFDRLAAEVRQDLGLDVDSGANLAEMITTSPEAYRFYLEGVEHCQKFYKPQALDAFRLALQLDSTMAMAYFYIARHRLGGDRKEMMDKAMRYSDKLPESQRRYVRALYEFVNGNLTEAITILEEAISRDSTDKDAYNDLAGMYLLIPGGIPDALKARKKVVELDPVNDHALNECAMNFLSLREYDSAAAYAARVIELVPEQANPYDTYALTLLTQGRYRDAADNFLKALSINPRLTYTHDVLARLYAYLGDQKMFDSCLALKMQLGTPNYRASARYDAATFFRYTGAFGDAAAITQDGIRNDSLEVDPAKTGMYPLMFTLKSWCYRELGAFDSARSAAERSVAESRSFGPSTQIVTASDLAMALASQGDVAGSRAALSSAAESLKSTSRSTSHAVYQTALGWLTFHAGAPDSAVAILQRAAEIDVEYYRPCVEFYLAQIYIERGQSQLAIPLLENWTVRIENLNWQEPEMFVKAYYFLGRAYQDLNERDQAVAHYRRFLDRWGGSSDRLPLVEEARVRLAQLTS